MEIVLEPKVFYSKNNKYFRLNIPKEVSNKLDLKEGDKILIKIMRVIR